MNQGVIEDRYPLSPMQEGMLFHSLLDAGSGVDIEQMIIDTEALDAGAFERAWRAVVAHHPILRTSFETAGTPMQRVHREVTLPFSIHDLAGLPDDAVEERFQSFLRADRRRGFDLDRAPLLRVAVFPLGALRARVVFTFHHILLDGRSFPVVIGDVFDAYEAERGGEAVDVGRDSASAGRSFALAPRRPYRDYIGWLASIDREASARFFRDALAGVTGPTPLPGGRQAPPKGAPADYAERTSVIGPSATRAIREGAERAGVALGTLVMGAWALVIARHAGEDEAILGVTRACRRTALGGEGTSDMAGMLINTLPLRVPIANDVEAGAWLRDVRDRFRALRDHEHTPLVEIRKSAGFGPEIDLFHNLLVYEDYLLDEVMRARGGAWEGRRIRLVEQTSLPLNLEVYGGSSITIKIGHDRRVISDDQAAILSAAIEGVLASLAADPSAKLGSVSVLAPEERARIARFNATAAPYPSDRTVPDLIEAQALRTPDAIAVIDGDSRLTYRELEARADALARALRARGVGPDVPAGVSLGRSAHLVIAIVAILKAGGAYVSLDPEYPRERLAFMLEDTRLPVIVTAREIASILPPSSASLILVEEPLGDHPPIDRRALTPENLAYLIYTSGSTGKPKGVAMTHRPLVNLVTWQLATRSEGAPPSPRTLQFASPSFDVCFQEIATTLASGGALVMIGEDDRRDPERLLAHLITHDVERIFLPPVALYQLAEVARDRDLPKNLREIIVAGEALRITPAVASMVARLPGAVVKNHYGPSETHVVTEEVLAGDPLAWPALPAIGKPIYNVRAHVLDAGGSPAPIGARGELFLGGVALARGYLDRPALTAERFLPDPFGGEGGGRERLYKTGDLVRWLPDGRLEFLGRADTQVKVRGFRVELGEIEVALGAFEGVREAVAIVRGEGQDSQNKRLVAYVVPKRADAPPSIADLRAHLGARLPEHMIPQAFVLLDALPLTATGKVDRRRLPEPEGGARTGRIAVPPRGPEEQAIASIFAEVLRIPVADVGAHDSFFELGGHSLLGAQVMGRLRRALGADLPLKALFEAKTVAALAAKIASSKGEGELDPIPRVDRGAPLALSFAQERLWFLAQLDPGDPSYNVPIALRLQGAIDEARLRGAFAKLAARHEPLRTTFRSEGDHPVAVIQDELPLSFVVTRPSGHDAGERLDAALREAAIEARAPFDLASGPLLRARLFAIDDHDHLLVVTMHHIVVDAWALSVLVRDLTALYAGEDLPPLPIAYADYAAFERARMSGDRVARSIDEVRAHLEGAPRTLTIAADHARPPSPSHRGRRVPIALDRATTAALSAIARREGATLFMVLLAAFDVFLRARSGERDVVVGSPIAGRTRAETEALAGPLINSLALRATIDPRASFTSLLAGVREACLFMFAHQDLPFERLVEAIAPSRDLSQTPIFQVMFVLQNAPSGALAIPGVTVTPVPIDSGTAKFDLVLELTETGDGLAGSLEYATDLFEHATAERMAGELSVICRAIAEDPSARVDDLPVIGAGERRLLLTELNRTAMDLPDLPVHAIVAATAAFQPDAPAIVEGDRVLSYGALLARADEVAAALAARGVGRGSFVALCLPRSIENVIAALAVLRAGAAYVALDPAHPDARLTFAIGEAGARVALTSRAIAPRLTGTTAEILCVDGMEALPPAPPAPSSPADPAYVIFTSGSTGTPKGVVVGHAGLTNLALWHLRAYALGQGDRTTLIAAPGFDAAVWEIWPSLAAGATLVIPDDDTRGDPSRLARWLVEARITVTFLPTPLAEAVLDETWPQGAALRTVLTGGDRLRKRPRPETPFSLVNHYGPTEYTVVTTAGAVTPAGEGLPPIGKPIANTQLYIVDDALRLVPMGVPSELLIGGAGIAHGYVNRPDLTAERFIPSPFVPGERLYRTGDRVRYRHDGSIEFLERADDQVKIRGNRIELGEIEAALADLPDVRAAAVNVDRRGEPRLVAYVVASGDAKLAFSSLRAALRERLPEYMVPSAFVAIDALPLTPNGKIDRRALPAHDATIDAEDERPFVAPKGPIEEAIAAIFADLLGLDQVSATDRFFDLGGHSLLATQAVSRIASVLAKDLPLRAIFEAPTARELAERLEGDRAEARSPIVRRAEGPALLSFEQERMWLLHQLDPESPAYVVPVPLRLHGPLDRSALRGAIDALVARHEVLRAVIRAGGDAPVMVVREPAPVAMDVVSFASMPAEEREDKLREACAIEAKTPFDLTKDPPIRARLVHMGEGDHALLLTLHHVVADGWTLGLLYRELGALYRAQKRGEPAPLAPLPLQYADYAAWQRARMAGDRLARDLAYWQRALEGAPPAIDLPADKPRPPALSSRGAWANVAFGADLSRRIKALGQREGATLFMTILAAYAVVLARYAGQGDVVIGTPIAGRSRVETEGMLGFFLNNLALRVRPDERASFSSLLRAVKETCLGAYAHQEIPFERVAAALAPARDAGRSPLFQVFFNLQSGAGMTSLPALDELAVTPIPFENTTTKFELTLILHEGSEGVAGYLSYATELFEPARIERLIGHLKNVLAEAADDPRRELRALSMLSSEEREQVLSIVNATGSPYESGELIHELFEAQADKTPNAEALVASDARLSFAELDARANRIAHVLRGLSVRAGGVVGLCLPRRASMVVAMLGIMKAGAGYLPLDASSPHARLAAILDEAKAQAVITVRDLRDRCEVSGVPLLSLDEDAATIDAAPSDRLRSGARDTDLAYVLFTSGSTGKPKGVAIEHRQLVNYTRGVAGRMALPEGARYAHISTFAADLGNTVLFPPLCFGGVLHVIPEELVTDPDGLGETFTREAIDCLKIVPSHFSALLSGSKPERVVPRRLLVFGGEASSWDLIATVERLSASCRVMNHYGPTETTVGVLTYAVHGRGSGPASGPSAPTPPVKRGAPEPLAPIVPLGRPLPNSRVYLLDAEMNPVPVGVPGEVWIGGAGVARGYINRPDLTDERFVPSPFIAGDRLYRTGDRAVRLPPGDIVFLGRIDFQVKIRGYRIELGEIEAAIGDHPDVKDVVVLAIGEGSDKRLVAFVVPSAAAASLASSSLAAFVATRLPDTMTPSAFVILDALPLTQNGKIDRRALAALAPDEDAIEGDQAAPKTPVEEVLANIWADVFERESVGVHERFADLGGHSLLAIQIVARARDAFQIELPLRSIFEAPTIALLAERVGAAIREGSGVAVAPITRRPEGEAPALSFAQERLWFLDHLEGKSAFYNVPAALRIEGDLDVAALTRAVEALVARHEVLRTTFATVKGQAIQVIHPPSPVKLDVIDLSHLPEPERSERASAIAADEARAPFDLEKGPLVRASIVRRSKADHTLLLTLHHIVSDAWTRGIVNREIGALYSGGSLPDLPVQYADYARWQRAWLTGPALDAALGYWKDKLKGTSFALELPADRPRPAVPSRRGAWKNFSIPAEVAARLRELARREGATLFMVLLAAFDVMIARLSGQRDFVVGSPVAGRSRPEIEGLAGFFVNTLVLRAELADDPSFSDLVARTRETCLGAYAHEDLPFERLVAELAPERDLSRTPLFQVMFMFQTARQDELSLAGLTLRPEEVSIGTSKFDLTLGLLETKSGAIEGAFEYTSDLFDEATIDRFAAVLSVVLDAASRDPSLTVGAIPVLSEADRAIVIAGPNRWNDPSVSFPVTATVHERFEAQVDRTPDAIAIVAGEARLTYRELDARGNRVARFLRARGAGPGTLVGLAVDRGVEMIVGLIGILKAGAAYLPLDPDYPRDRLAFMATDAKVPIVLSQASKQGSVPATSAEVVLLDEAWSAIAEHGAERLDRTANPGDLAYVIYTSGSTGKPKGAMVTHANVVRLFDATDAWYGFGPRDVWTMFHSYAFDFSVWEIWGALFYGGRVVIVPYLVSRSPEDFYALCAAEGVTVLNQTPSAFRQFVRADEAASEAARAALRLRYVIFGGEALDLGDLRPWWQRHGDATPSLVNMYGITETTVHVTYRPVSIADLSRPWSSVIGRPIPDLQVYVLDERREPVPLGVKGEMYVGGAGVANGYLSRPELTAERFLDDPFSPGKKLYKTGDLARYTAAGELEYLGRIDHQVKIRGHRIELGEIEAALDAHPSVREKIVVARDDGAGQKRLVAYLVCREGERPSAGDLRAFLKQKLPDPMIPSAFVLLDHMPLTENGKIDRRALPAPEEGERAAADAAFVAPEGRVEEVLARVWAAVLKLDRVGAHDNFFEIGGDSILSIQIVARARAEGVVIQARDLFQHPTIAELARVAGAEVTVAEQGVVTGPVTPTPIMRWWFEQQPIDPHHDNQAFLLRARAPIEAAVVERALAALALHHDALRITASTSARDGSLHVAIAPPAQGTIAVERVDLGAIDEDQIAAAIASHADRAQQSLDPASGRNVAARLFARGERRWLLLVIHHLAVDGVSWRVLLDDLERAVSAINQGEAPSLPPKTTSYQRWAERLDEHARSGALDGEAAYWIASAARRAGVLPGDPSAIDTEGGASRVRVTLSESETNALLREVPEAYNTRIDDVLLAALALALAPVTGSRTARVALEGHGREDIVEGVDTSRTVGWFTAIYPVVIEAPEGGVGEVIKAVKEELRAIPNKGVGYGVLRYLGEGAVSRALAAAPAPEVSFNYLGQLDRAVSDEGLFAIATEPKGASKSPRRRRPFALDVNASVLGGALDVYFTFGEGRLQRDLVERLAKGYVEALRAIIAHCKAEGAGGYTPSDFQKANLGSQEELNSLLDDLGDDDL